MAVIKPKMYKGKALPLRLCGHPEWDLSRPDKPKPPPCYVRYHCDCGENWGCPECGWGAGTHPCTCMRERQAEDIKQHPEKYPYINLVPSPTMTPGTAAISGADGKVHYITGLENDLAEIA